MPSTYDSLLRLELQATGENANSWGTKTNTNLELISQAIAGHVSVAVAGSGDYTLTASNAVSDEARRAFLSLSGTLTGNRNIIVPSNSKIYFIRRNTSGAFDITFKTASGTGATIPTGSGLCIVACDGTDCWNVTDETKIAVTGGEFTGPVSVSVSTSVSGGAAFTITQVGAGPLLVLNDSAGDATPTVFDANGRHLIGTSTPHNITGYNQPFLQIQRNGSNAGYGLVAWVSSALGPTSQIMKSRSDTIGTHAAVTIDDELGIHVYGGDDGDEFVAAAAIAIKVDATVSASVVPGAVVIQTAGSDGVLTERARFDSNGYLGIGTNDPAAKVDISGTGALLKIGNAVVSAPVGDAPFQGCRAYISYEPATGTTKRAFNVSSVVKNATGDFTISFTTSLTTNTYIMLPWGNAVGRGLVASIPTGLTAGAARVQFRASDTFALEDPTEFHVAFIQ